MQCSSKLQLQDWSDYLSRDSYKMVRAYIYKKESWKRKAKATTVGVEPTTFWSEVRRANPLRYAVLRAKRFSKI